MLEVDFIRANIVAMLKQKINSTYRLHLVKSPVLLMDVNSVQRI